MLCFPLDNIEYEANALGAWLGTRTRGVFSADSNLAVTANGDMTVTVSPGLAWLKMEDFWGTVCLQADNLTLTVPTAHPNLSRIDAVCARLDKNANAAEIVIKTGTPAISHVIAPPTRDINYDEIYLATVTVPSGTIAISEGNISDRRMSEEYCGLMRDGVTGIPTEMLYQAWYAWFESLKNTSQAELEAWLNTFIALHEQSFAEWFQTVQDTLDGDTAGNLLNLINAHTWKGIYSTEGVHGVRFSDGKIQAFNGVDWADIPMEYFGPNNPPPLSGLGIYTGAAPPSSTLGKDGDIYIKI